jgi:hypothetical protein
MLAALIFSLQASASSLLPEKIVGQWTVDLAACGGEDTEGVRIRRDAIDFYEAHGRVRQATREGQHISARVDFTGEGRTWSETVTIIPATDNSGTSIMMYALGQKSVFERCPK